MSPLDGILDTVVIGGGQAGLAIAWHLQQAASRFVVLDAGPETGHSWRSRWDSLTLFTPTQYDSLPGMPFPGPVDSYPTKEQVADYLRDYAATFDLPIRNHTTVTRLTRRGEEFEVHTVEETLRARHVVVATGAFQVPFVPPLAAGLAADVVQLHSGAYRNPQDLPAGQVLVVGAGNSGLQIAAELAATHPVAVAVGSKTQPVPQRLLGKDLFWWFTLTQLMSKPADSRLARRVRARGEMVVGTSRRRLRRGGIDFRTRVIGGTGTRVRFDDGSDLAVATVIWATGYRPDYSWIDVPGVIADGKVAHQRGATAVPGLYFLGLPWQHTRGSSLLGFVQHDAAYLAERMQQPDRSSIPEPVRS